MDISLNGHEARALGVLIEKAFTTPDQYPLSLNATTNGCNQKSNRDPVTDFSEAEVRIALQGLRMKGLAGQSVPAGSRVERWRHNAMETLGIGEREAAVLAELLLQVLSAQAPGEVQGAQRLLREARAAQERGLLAQQLEVVGGLGQGALDLPQLGVAHAPSRGS